jgi:phosphoribosylanthranilate isomerase
MVKIKICGLTRFEDIDAVNAAMPDYVGFVFAEKSRRRVTFSVAERLSGRLHPPIIPVGVFVNSPIADITGLYRRGVIRIAQLHGGESAEYIAELRRAGIPVIQAIRAGQGDAPSELADYHLFDGAEGGGGVRFNWSLIPKSSKPTFLAGGLNTGNIANALKLRPFAVDVSSGAETDGYKDLKKIRALVERVRMEGKYD